MNKEKERSFGIFPYSFKVVGYVLTGIGLVVVIYNAFIAHFDFWETIWNFLVVSLTLVVFSRDKIQDERTLYLNTKFLSYSFLGTAVNILILGLFRFWDAEFPLFSAQIGILLTYFTYVILKIKYAILDKK